MQSLIRIEEMVFRGKLIIQELMVVCFCWIFLQLHVRDKNKYKNKQKTKEQLMLSISHQGLTTLK